MTHPGVDVIAAQLSGSALFGTTIAEQREAMTRMAASSPPPAGVGVEPVSLGGRPAERLTPAGARPNGAVLYLHGGGYCIGGLDSHRDLAGRLAIATGYPVVTLDYRLAPEHPFPAALEDACAAYTELVAMGAGPHRLAIAGDSAGGGLTVATLLALRDSGVALPAAAACLSPWVDLTQSASAYDTVGESDPMVTRTGLDLMASSYLGATDPRTPLASPLWADDLGGLPPVRIDVGEREVLVDDASRLAARLEGSGVPVSLTVWPGLIHVFQAFPASLIPEAGESVEAIGHFLATHLEAGAPTGSPTPA
jgi:acetyl esterase/lipase